MFKSSQPTFKSASWRARENLTSFKNILMRMSWDFKSSWEKETFVSTKAHENFSWDLAFSHDCFLMRFSWESHENLNAHENFCKGTAVLLLTSINSGACKCALFFTFSFWLIAYKLVAKPSPSHSKFVAFRINMRTFEAGHPNDAGTSVLRLPWSMAIKSIRLLHCRWCMFLVHRSTGGSYTAR